jgi:hypothetical protein
LSADSDETELCVINNETVAAAEVELTITSGYSGDNYRVKATLDDDHTQSDQTCLMTAWKRIYLERDRMYKTYVLDHDGQPDRIWVDNNDDFATGDRVVFFIPGGDLCEATLLGKGGEGSPPDDTHYILVPDGSVAVSKYDGVKLKSNDETYANVDLRYLGKCYGDDPRGAEHDGCFVEFSEEGVYGGGPMPKYSMLIRNDPTASLFINNWFLNKYSKGNCFLLISIGHSDALGWADQQKHHCVLAVGAIAGDYVNWEVARDEVACHEMGHQFVATAGHVDQNAQVWNHDHSDYCIMSYADNPENGITEFCKDHCYEVRDAGDPR